MASYRGQHLQICDIPAPGFYNAGRSTLDRLARRFESGHGEPPLQEMKAYGWYPSFCHWTNNASWAVVQ
jgi:hypothetical protein